MEELHDRVITVERDVKELRRDHDELRTDYAEDHRRLTKVELDIASRLSSVQAGVNQLLNSGTDTRLGELERWRANLNGRWTVYAFVGAAIAATFGGLVTKLAIEPAFSPRPTDASTGTLPVDNLNRYFLPAPR